MSDQFVRREKRKIILQTKMIKKYITLTFWRRQTDNCQLYHSALGLYLMQMKKQENKGNQSGARITCV